MPALRQHIPCPFFYAGAAAVMGNLLLRASRAVSLAATVSPSDVPSVAAPSAAAVPAHRWENRALLVFALLYAALYAAFWPHAATTMDEASYLGFAHVLRHGTMFADRVPATVLLAISAGDHFVSKYPLGMSALLALVSLAGGWLAALGTNLLVHLATFWLVIKMLRERGLSPLWALLFLFHPTAVLYSRTVMADPSSGFLLALGLWSLQKGRWVYAGLWAGLALTFRTGNVVAVPVFVGAAFLGQAAQTKWVSRLLPAVKIVAGSVPGLLLAAYYVVIVTRGQMGSNTGTFGLQYFPSMFGGYMVMLMVLYPALLLAPLLCLRSRRDTFAWASAGLCYGVFGLYSFWYYRDQGGSAFETLIVGQRYFLAVMPVFIVSYADVLQGFLGPRFRARFASLPVPAQRRVTTVFAGATFLVCAGLGAGIHARHNKLLNQIAQVRGAVLQATRPDDLLFCNAQIGKLLPPAWGNRIVMIPAGVSDDVQTIMNKMGDPRQTSGRERGEIAAVGAMAQPPGRVVFASWVRAGRTEDKEDADRLATVAKKLAPRYRLRQADGAQGVGVPEGVTLQFLERVEPKEIK